MSRRVPVCPICQKPVPVNRGEDPNIRVNEHIAAGCANPGTTTTPSPTSANHCSNRGCKARTLVPIYCPKCKLNFCVKHRLEVDHQCRSLGAGGGRARSVSPNPSTSSGSGTAQRNTPAALAAMKRSEAAKAKGTPMSIPRAGSAPPITSGGGPRGREAPAATGGPRGGAPSGASSSAARPVSVATSNTHGATGGGAADALTRVEMERQRKERQQQRLVLEEKARKGVSQLLFRITGGFFFLERWCVHRPTLVNLC
ncbi:hypothetical protein BC938DRAFT_483738 [Jimgerdemannia flammicorona]|uniref:AN1-type domain-containing protein n=1 Tax=Jimgerdemannia flammicorona TaxID=994334 RepID=A0A433QVQ0_9FUNG|nr:hypothetical protein BC938DRAFT_483738 [Jimgerdemannia flammicorona]